MLIEITNPKKQILNKLQYRKNKILNITQRLWLCVVWEFETIIFQFTTNFI